jgi:hypothetical protein
MAEKIIKAKVSAGAKTEKIEEVEPDFFKIRVSEPPEKGRANERVLEIVAEYFGVPKFRVFLKSGHSYREKVILVDLKSQQ